MVIADATLDPDVWESVKDKLVAAAPHTTNSTTREETTASIRASYNDENGSRPQVVIDPVKSSEDSWVFGSKQGMKTINVIVFCYADTSLGVDQLFSQVSDTLKDNDIDGLDLIAVVSDYEPPNPNGVKAHCKSATFMYERG